MLPSVLSGNFGYSCFPAPVWSRSKGTASCVQDRSLSRHLSPFLRFRHAPTLKQRRASLWCATFRSRSLQKSHRPRSSIAARGLKIGVSVVDRGGHVLISMRDDGTAHHVIELAERKAYTARIFRQTTGQFVDRIINNPRSQGLKDTKGALASLGGVPIKVGDDTIGGVGVSGAPGGVNDEACAAAGIEKVAAQLK